MAIQKITSNVLADGAVSASNLEDGSVSASKLAAGSVSASSLGDNSVTEAKLADSSISTAKLADNSVSSAKLANNSVGIDQLNLSDGTNGQILTTNGSGTISFADAAGGGGAWNVISSQTVSSAVSSVEFTSITGYTHYVLQISNLLPSDSKALRYTAAYDGGSTYITTGYNRNLMFPANNTTGTVSGDLTSNLPYAEVSNSFGTNLPGQAQLWFGNASSSVSAICFNAPGTSTTPPAALSVANTFNTGYLTSAITKLKFVMQTGNINSATFTLYGLATS